MKRIEITMTNTDETRQAEFFAILDKDPHKGFTAREINDLVIDNRVHYTLTLREQALITLLASIHTDSDSVASNYPIVMQDMIRGEVVKAGIQSLRALGVTKLELAQGALDYNAMMGSTVDREKVMNEIEHEQTAQNDAMAELSELLFGKGGM
jgi:hypothetical protein